MPHRVRPDVLDARLPSRDLNGTEQVPRVDHRPELGSEHRPGIRPLIPGL
jgi:hypothetical protein